MEVFPLYDVDEAIWVVEIDGAEICAKSLHDLQAKLPSAVIHDYYPNGFVAIRDGFLEFTTHVPFIVHHWNLKQQQPNRIFYRTEIAEIAEKVVVVSPKEKRRLLHEEIMNLAVQCWRSQKIAEELHVSLGIVQTHRLEAARDGDPRALVKPRRIVVRTRKNHDWTDADDLLLRHKAQEGLSASSISSMIGCTRNAVIGRSHRLGVHLCGKPLH